MNVADQQSHLPIEFEANWTVRDISTAPASTCASRASKALHGRLDLWESEGAKWRQKAVAGAHVSFTIRSHEPISFMFLVLTVSLGFHPSPTADKLKAKEQNKLFVRVPALQLLTVVTRIRITYPSSTAFIEQRRVRIYIYTWRSIWTVVAPVLACSLTPVPNEDCVASHLSLFILLLLRTFIVFFPLSQNKSCDWKLFLPWQNE